MLRPQEFLHLCTAEVAIMDVCWAIRKKAWGQPVASRETSPSEASKLYWQDSSSRVRRHRKTFRLSLPAGAVTETSCPIGSRVLGANMLTRKILCSSLFLVACRRVTITSLLASKLSWPVAAKSYSPSNIIRSEE